MIIYVNVADSQSPSDLSSGPRISLGPIFVLDPQNTTFPLHLPAQWATQDLASDPFPSPHLLHGSLGLIGFLAPVTVGPEVSLHSPQPLHS